MSRVPLPVVRRRYQIQADRHLVRDDLEAFRDAGEVESYDVEIGGNPATVAYDVVGVDRPEWDARFKRAVDVHREMLRRAGEVHASDVEADGGTTP